MFGRTGEERHPRQYNRKEDTMTLYAFYSEEAVKAGCGILVYKRADGDMVVCTAVDTNPSGQDYPWNDKIALGEVVDFMLRATENSPTPGMIDKICALAGRALGHFATGLIFGLGAGVALKLMGVVP
jgi:hypothetical protein